MSLDNFKLILSTVYRDIDRAFWSVEFKVILLFKKSYQIPEAGMFFEKPLLVSGLFFHFLQEYKV